MLPQIECTCHVLIDFYYLFNVVCNEKLFHTALRLRINEVQMAKVFYFRGAGKEKQFHCCWLNKKRNIFVFFSKSTRAFCMESFSMNNLKLFRWIFFIILPFRDVTYIFFLFQSIGKLVVKFAHWNNIEILNYSLMAHNNANKSMCVSEQSAKRGMFEFNISTEDNKIEFVTNFTKNSMP
jgi:hypothetical protein